MSITPASDAAVPALPEEDLMIGLEDIDESDLVMPTIKIEHKKGVWIDGLSNEEYPSLTVILLGLIKQRVLWEAEVEENSKGPLCRSYDFEIGRPDIERFPWKASGFTQPDSSSGEVTLPCTSCPLKDWGSHPNRDTPWCSAQHTFAVMQEMENGGYSPALLTIQRSALKPSQTYMSSFVRNKKPLFTVKTRIDLDHRKRGTVDFAVPKFMSAGDTDPADWPEFAKNYRQIREFVQTPRGRDDEDDVAPAAAAPAAATASGPAAAPAAAPAASTPDDDDLPF